VLLFSVKFLKSNIDTLLGGVKNLVKYPFMSKEMTFAQKQSAKNILNIVSNIAFILFVANSFDDDSVTFDPRSSDFGKIKIGDTRFDVTGGMGSLVTLLSRVVVPTMHDGELGLWQQTSGGWTNLTEGGFGKQTAWGVLGNFASGKMSPLGGGVRDVMKG
jgi:hypothetical protein